MTKNTGLARRAAQELTAAGGALFRAGTLPEVIRHVITSGEREPFNLLNLIDTAIEQTSTYAIRAVDEADAISRMEVDHA